MSLCFVTSALKVPRIQSVKFARNDSQLSRIISWNYRLFVPQTEQRCLSVCLSVTNDREPCKTVEPIEMAFRMWTRLGQRNYV